MRFKRVWFFSFRMKEFICALKTMKKLDYVNSEPRSWRGVLINNGETNKDKI